MKKLLCIILALTMSVLVGCGGGEAESTVKTPTKVTNETYQSYWMKQFDYKTMPIAAFNGAPPKILAYKESMITDAHYKTMSEAYFNTTYALYDRTASYADDVIESLKLAEKYNISYVAIDTSFPTMSDEIVLRNTITKALLQDRPKALGGVIIVDEPSRVNFEKIKTSKTLFKKVLGEKALLHANLFPNGAAQYQLYDSSKVQAVPEGGYSYTQYVEDFLEIYEPQVLSYDYYPMLSNGSIASPYFSNMSYIRKKAAEKQIPFWTYIQSCKYNKNVRIPTENDIKWEVNTSLAYGCKGIQYFTYVVALASGGEEFTGGAIDETGAKTDLYPAIAAANKFVSEVDEVLMCCLSKGVMTAGSTPCPIPEEDVLSEYGALKSVSGESVLVGCFDYNGKDAYYVVNNSITGDCTATLTFSGAKNGFTQNADGKSEFKDKTSLEIKLSAGEATLVVLD